MLCGPLLTVLGVPRSVSTLPYALTGFSLLALVARIPPSPPSRAVAELVTRNSIYRSGYELLYAPLPPEQKRPTKVVLDVGADKLGDILAAQLVGAILYLATDSRTVLLVAAAITGAVGIIVTLRLPRSYTQSLEESLLEKGRELPALEGVQPSLGPEPWVSLTALPTLGHPADAIPLRFRRRKRRSPEPPPAPAVASVQPDPEASTTDRLLSLLRDLRSKDRLRIEAALVEALPTEAAPLAIELVGGDDAIARAAAGALRGAAPRCTGTLVDALLDLSRDERLRRRLPAILAAGEPELAAWGLWRGMRDPCFEVRYHCSAVLAALAADTKLAAVEPEAVFDYVRTELRVGRDEWMSRKLAGDPMIDAQELETDLGLAHVFRVLALVLPAEPLRIALRAVQAEDLSLRGMALEYLESILPADVRAQLWPLLDETGETSEATVHTMVDEVEAASRSSTLLERMRELHPAIFEHAHVRKSG